MNRTHRPWFRATCLILSYLLYFDLLASSALQWVGRRSFAGPSASAAASEGSDEQDAVGGVAGASRTIFVSATDATCGGRFPCFTQIQKAIDAAIPGDHIVVFPGLYPERLRIIDKNRHSGASEADRIKLFADPLAPIGRVVGMIMRLAPIGAFGATAFTIGRYGVGTLFALGKLMLSVYATCLLFVFVVLGLIARMSGFSLWKLLKYIKEEILIVLGTSSSESVLPRVMAKLEHLGCSKSVVGLVVPTGYSFNLDGTSIYMTMGAIFVAQATNAHLSLADELEILAILLLTSKGAAAVTGSGFITLAATLAAFPRIPVVGLALLVGVDRFMSEARAITNLIGNAVATVAIARWDGTLDRARAARVLDGESPRREPVDGTDWLDSADSTPPLGPQPNPASQSAAAVS